MAAVGTGVQANETNNAAKRQDEIAAQGIQMQSAKQREADARVSQEVNKLQSSTPEDSQEQATNAFMDQLKRTRAQSRGEGTVGNVSSAYAADSDAANKSVDQFGKSRASLLGRINAPGLQREQEGISRSRAGVDLGLIARAANGDNFLTQLRAKQSGANPWVMAGGQMLSSAGSGMATQGGYDVPDTYTDMPGGGFINHAPKKVGGYAGYGFGGGFGGGVPK
jgi:hypothetical protein